MGRVGVDRLAQGGLLGAGGGGNSSQDTVTASLTVAANPNEVAHTLGVEPTAWIIQDSTGRILTYAAGPKTGSETTILEVTALVDTPNARITVFAGS